MAQAVVYIHGQGGSPEEAKHYAPLFESCATIGLDYCSATPWDAKSEFPKLLEPVFARYGTVTLIANSIGAFFAMNALADQKIKQAFFISPVVDMEKLITDMMGWANVTESELREKGTIETAFGQTLSWNYLCYVRERPVSWKVPTHILYAGRDNLTSPATISAFAARIGASLTVMDKGEHWFHTEEQMRFLDRWITGRKEL